ncbi:holo-ACP synthase [Virgibacillus siamensis]|uniref:holo-ACP synthase n=1 Tax=Virgibacillus siamensis TaxID=480071 RepID=UPI000984F1F0|nr:holo-ACP synthase [Virgibacillus siamensis]
MIKGIGIDIIELDRIQKALANNNRFADRILTGTEQANGFDRITNPHRKTEFLAGRFAAKEAFAKACGRGIGELSFHDMEVAADEFGAPSMKVGGYEECRIHLSITHSRDYAVAQVVIEEK